MSATTPEAPTATPTEERAEVKRRLDTKAATLAGLTDRWDEIYYDSRGWAGKPSALIKVDAQPQSARVGVSEMTMFLDALLEKARPAARSPYEPTRLLRDEGVAYVEVLGQWYDAAPFALIRPDEVAQSGYMDKVLLLGWRSGELVMLLGVAYPRDPEAGQ